MNLIELTLWPLLAPLFGGAAVSFFLRAGKYKHVPGLLFHSILPKTTLSLSQLSTKRFENFVELLKVYNKKTVTVSDAIGIKNSKEEHIALTFDDGLDDFYFHALEPLQRRELKVTLFPVAGFAGKNVTWDVTGRRQHISKQMLREISGYGHEIGSHSLTHANLPWLDDKDLTHELTESKKILEDITGKEVKCISFPFGSWDMRVWELAREAGYSSATLYRGYRNAHSTHLPVFGVYRFDTAQDIFARAFPQSEWSFSRAAAKIMSHFSKGAPLWKYRKEYEKQDRNTCKK